MDDRLHHWIDRLQRSAYRADWGIRLGRLLGTPADVRVVRHTILLDRYPAGAPPLRIGFASDFHAGPTTDPRLLARAFAALIAAAPDLILLGGDFVSLEAGDVDCISSELAGLKAPLGCYAVLGNHDHWTSARHIEQCLEDTGIEVLTNRNIRLPPPFDSIWLCGLDDHWHGRPDAAATFNGADGVRILLMHAPSGLLDLRPHRFDLALSGHTHGGQIALPGGRPLLLPHGELSGVYPRGRFETAAGTLVVSVGLGCSVLPVRLFADPEILLCDVRGVT